MRQISAKTEDTTNGGETKTNGDATNGGETVTETNGDATNGGVSWNNSIRQQIEQKLLRIIALLNDDN